MAGPPGQNMVIYRSGPKAAIDIIHEPGGPSGTTRSVIDLDSHSHYDWDTTNPGNGCSVGKWSGNWGDPFEETKGFQDELTKAGGKVVGNEAVNGAAAKVFEAGMPDGSKARMWVDDKSGLLLKLQSTDKSGKSQTMTEVKSVSLSKPPDSVFEIPPSCVAAAHPPVDPDFEVATTAPASQDACVVWVRVVKAGSMETIKGGFRMGIDLAINTLHPAEHNVGQGPDGNGVFSGGGIREMSGQFKDGVLRLGRIATMFYIASVFDNNRGFASAMMYRKCFGPQTMLLMVVKDPNNIGKGVDYLWDKKGKYLPTSAGGN